MGPDITREIILSNKLSKIRFLVIYENAYLAVKKIQITSHLDTPENEWRPLIENLTLNFILKGSQAHTVKIPIAFVTLASSFNSRPEFDIDLTLPDNLSKMTRYTGGKWESIEISVDSKKPYEFELKVFFESDMIQG